MIIQDILDNDIVRSYSNSGFMLSGGFPSGLYAVVYDPVSAHREYVETDIPIEKGELPIGRREISKRKLMNNLKEMEVWQQVKQYLIANDLWDDWETSTILDESDPFFKGAMGALKNLLSLTDLQIEELISNSISTYRY